ncbi:MAG: nucleotidyltransferase domain-containing protein [Candidatus Bathyarchaeia archaeon]
MSIPSKLRSVLETFIEDLEARETISGIGLFGSWSRGMAASSSDIDLLIVEGRDFDYEYVERVEINNYLIDLNYIPKHWISHRVPPEIDQKLYELQVLFDRDGSLTRAKDLMSKVYLRPERVEIRTEAHLVEADTFLSRARLALNRGDYRSAKANSIKGFWALMKILIEIGKKPVLNSFFIRNLESASKTLDMYTLYETYINLAGFAGRSKTDVKIMLDSLLSTWRGMIDFITASLPLPRNIHPKIGYKLSYYGREIFLRGLVARVSDLIDESTPIESSNYMFHTLADALESYTYLASTLEGVRFDYATILKYLSESKKSPIKVYEGAINVLGVKEVSSQEAEKALKSVTDIALNIRQRRKDLIAHFIK